MSSWWKFARKPQASERVTTGRFEIEGDGEVAYLQYSISGNVLELIHTEVPEKLRHRGMAASLAERALKWARENKYKVDIVCPFVQEYVDKHPAYKDLILR